MSGSVVVASTGEVLASKLRRARGAGERARGLIATKALEQGEALVIEGGRRIHTFAMRYPIDVLFCDAHWEVIHIVRGMPPMRITRWVRRARYVIELPEGAVPPAFAPGDRLLVTLER